MKIKKFLNKVSIRSFCKDRMSQKIKRIENETNRESLNALLKQIQCQNIYTKLSVFEGGRSMVEMLGVLAVVGVLSVGGIVGYRYAMNLYQANQIANELNLNRNELLIEMTNEKPVLVLGAPYDTGEVIGEGHIVFNEHGYEYDCGSVDGEAPSDCRDEDRYYMIVKDVTTGVCRPLTQLVKHLPGLIEMRINNVPDTEGGSCGSVGVEERNEVTLSFAATVPLEEEQPEGYCENDDECENGRCNGDNVCVECIEDADCTGAMKRCDGTSNICVECVGNEDCDEICDIENHICCACSSVDLEKPIWNTATNVCEACPADKPYFDGLHCIACFIPSYNEDTPIWNSETKACEPCPAETPKYNKTTKACETCPADKPYFNRNRCVPCYDIYYSNKPYWNAETKQCEKCPTELPYFNLSTKQCETCPVNSPFYNGSSCVKCKDYSTSTPYWNAETKQCEGCPEDKPIYNQWSGECSECFIPSYNEDTPIWNPETKACEPCPAETPKYNETTKACEACPADKPYFNRNRCASCYDIYYADKPYWNPETKACEVCPADKPYFNGYECASCYDIYYTDKPYWNPETKRCESCPTETPNYNETTKACEACPADKPYFDRYGCVSCYDIYYANKPYWNPETKQCEACPADKPYWNWNSDVQDCEACPEDKPYFNGHECFACYLINSDKPYWNPETKQCEACPADRPYWDGSSDVQDCVATINCLSMGCGSGEYCSTIKDDDGCYYGDEDECRNANNDVLSYHSATRPPFVMSKVALTYKSAIRFCQSLGKTLVSPSDYNCPYLKSDGSYSRYCLKDSTSNEVAPRIQEMRDAYGNYTTWMMEGNYYGSLLELSNGYMNDLPGSGCNKFYAVCK